jgi:protocatechuate 3,4-dioxygenase alpha subunit
MPKLRQTPSQTIGPYFAYGLTPVQYGYPFKGIAPPPPQQNFTEAISIEGCIYDGAGVVMDDALVEIWVEQTRFFARCGTGSHAENRFQFKLPKPPSLSHQPAPFITACIFARGLLNHCFTRIYFEDDAERNAHDPVLALVEEQRRQTLIAAQLAPGQYRFDIHMQGAKETVFFDF